MLTTFSGSSLMRDDRGWLCLPALDLGISLSAPFYAMLQLKLPSPLVLRQVRPCCLPFSPKTVSVSLIDLSPSFLQVAVECKRYTGQEASSAGLVTLLSPDVPRSNPRTHVWICSRWIGAVPLNI